MRFILKPILSGDILQYMNRGFKIFIFSSFIIVLAIAIVLVSFVGATFSSINKNVEEQICRLESLRNAYGSGSYKPVDEQTFCDFDLHAALEKDIKLIDLQFLATHNSYKKEKTALERFYAGFSKELKSGDYYFENPTQQLNAGVRSFEFDLFYRQGKNSVTFHSFHIGFADMSSHCFDFALCLEEIDLWSQNNPNHLPITIILELKSRGGMYPYKPLTSKQLGDLDKLIKDKIKTLYTPAEAVKGYDNLNEMRANEASPTLKETLGKVMFILHPSDLTSSYINIDSSYKSQVMFPAAYFWWDEAVGTNSFVIINNHGVTENSIDNNGGRKNKYLFRIMLDDEYPNIEQLEKAITTGATICSTNRPPIIDKRAGYKSINFAPYEKTVRLVGDMVI